MHGIGSVMIYLLLIFQPGPFPGVRPPVGGAGFQAPPPKGGGTMGIIMPLYTIAIVVFFVYTIMKVRSKRKRTTITSKFHEKWMKMLHSCLYTDSVP